MWAALGSPRMLLSAHTCGYWATSSAKGQKGWFKETEPTFALPLIAELASTVSKQNALIPTIERWQGFELREKC